MSARPSSRWLGGLLAAPLGCSAEMVTLGRGLPDPAFGDTGQPVKALNLRSTDEDSPTLTEDLLDIYFTSRRSGLGKRDVWTAHRERREDAFAEPNLVDAASSADDEVSPAISRDGLTLWVATDRSGRGDLDLWRTERATRESPWGQLAPVDELNSPSDDLPRPPAQGELVMPLASRRDDPRYLQTYFAVRPATNTPFRDIVPVDELWLPDTAMSGGFLTEDGLLLFFQREVALRGDLYVAWRGSTRERFQPPLALNALNTDADERFPWINIDQTRFFFASDREIDQGLDILATTLDLPRFE